MTNSEKRHDDEAFVGKEFGSRKFELSNKTVEDYFEGLRVDNAWYESESPYKGSIAPSMVIIEAESMLG
ncbi:MAG: hypothetical protein QF530_09705, partial [SAR202 cluster bacterium]|nr:hypothetical protein [SAR202 cluster bacterium]